jgi:hypothetical protein
MKKILLLLLLSSIAYGQTSRTGTLSLPLWTTGDTLKAGGTALSNSGASGTGLNNLSLRLDTLLTKFIFNGSGLIKQVRGSGTGALDITSNSTHTQYITMSDSVDMAYNLRVQGDQLLYGNLRVGGYIFTDSIQLSGGRLSLGGGDITSVDSLEVTNSLNFRGSYAILGDSILVGRPSIDVGRIRFGDGASGVARLVNSIGNNATITLPSKDGTLLVATADTSAFSGSNTRVAVYISGATASDKYHVTPRNSNGSDTLPVTDDFMSYQAKIDSLIVYRVAGTTSGLKFSYLRAK